MTAENAVHAAGSAMSADAGAIRAWMVDYITSVIDMPKDGFPVEDRFDAYGLDSVELVIMCGMMEEAFSVPVEPGELFENPSVALFADHLAGRIAAKAA